MPHIIFSNAVINGLAVTAIIEDVRSLHQAQVLRCILHRGVNCFGNLVDRHFIFHQQPKNLDAVRMAEILESLNGDSATSLSFWISASDNSPVFLFSSTFAAAHMAWASMKFMPLIFLSENMSFLSPGISVLAIRTICLNFYVSAILKLYFGQKPPNVVF